MNTSTPIEVTDLRKTYPGDVEAVRGISFTASEGEVFGLLGPNGAGKSTTVGMLTTTILPTGGSAQLGGYDVVRDALAARSIASVVFQEPVVDRSLTGRRNLDLHARLWRVPAGEARARIDELAGVLHLGELLDRAAGSYSGGERRRLEIARALVSRPRVLFLDEPTAALDPRIRAELIDVIGSLRDRTQTTVLLTTHYLDEAERLCDRLAIIHEGTIVALDTAAALRAHLGEKLVELRAADNPQLAFAELRRLGIAGEDAFSVGATITLPLHGRSAPEAIGAIESCGVRTTSITSRAPTLDDVYLRLTGGQLTDAA
ncbi:MAG TPA: ABC transporter ATP-binding protein [Gaiellaceae bacterium]|nr:ABC transporter ATP-binding protein [Gaiellaceae bacterium]